MTILIDTEDSICFLTLNRAEKHNAFDNQFLMELQKALDAAIADPCVRVIMLKANGSHFSAGADLHWMQSMALLHEKDNIDDAMILANLIHTLYTSPKPTIAVVQGSAFGGGAGLAAACDITIASQSAMFCFSETRLGLIPAVISPYIVKAIGARAAKALFISAEPFDATTALTLGLVQHLASEENLLTYALSYANRLTKLAPLAMADIKGLIELVDNRPIDENLIRQTAVLIAKKRCSEEGQIGLKAFLTKQKPNWNPA